MTEIKIPFTKTSIKKIPADKLDSNSKGLELEISTNFKIGTGLGIDLSKCHGGTPENTFAKMVFVFKDGTENTFYNSLLDSNKNNFELSFDKEKVFLMTGGFANFIDKTKPEIQVYPAPNSRLMTVFFDPKFAGIIKLTESGQPTPPVPNPQPNPQTPEPTPNSISIQFTKKSAKKADLSELRKGDREAEGVEMEVEPFTLNTQRHRTKTFDKIVVIDNKNQNSDKLSFLLDSANQNIQINFLNNAKIDKWKGHEGGLISEQPNVTWKTGCEKELNIYLNDVFGFKPNEISISKTGEPQNDDNRERERERDENGQNGSDKPTQQEIANLKTELDQVKNDLEKLKKFISKVKKKAQDNGKDNPDLKNILKKSEDHLKNLEKKTPTQTSPDKGSWPKKVVIPIVLVLAVITFIGIFFWIRKKKQQKN